MALKTQKKPKAKAPSSSVEEQEALHRFMDMSYDVMIIAEGDGSIGFANAAFETVFGYARGELEALRFFDLFETKPDPGKLENFTARMHTKDGHAHWMEWHCETKGSRLYCVGRDLTGSKRHEAALIKQQKQLSEAESIGRMGHWHWTIGQDDIEWSAEIFRIFGVSGDEFSPSIHALNQLVHKRDVGRVIQGFQRAIIEEQNYDMEFRIMRPDGDARYIHCEGRCEKDEHGEVVALFGIMQDMTERMLYERELREAKESAERAYAAKSQFLTNMSHELRTPLNAVIGFSEMMQQQLLGPIGNDKYLEYINGIHESGEHLLDLISDILNMSKIEAGKYELDLEQLGVVKIIQAACHMIEMRAQESNITISLDQMKNKKLQIIADRRALMQMLLNLLSNAVKFTKDGGSISVECHERKDFISIKIIDNGIGIPANKLASITRPFEQVSLSYARDHEGSGLGLAITKELAELHGGSFLIDSTLGVGTTATMRLPYDASKTAP